MDDDIYTTEHPREQWAYLQRGVIIEFPSYGLIHYEEPEPDLKLLSREPAS